MDYDLGLNPKLQKISEAVAPMVDGFFFEF
jgi:hypothetical protein